MRVSMFVNTEGTRLPGCFSPGSLHFEACLPRCRQVVSSKEHDLCNVKATLWSNLAVCYF